MSASPRKILDDWVSGKTFYVLHAAELADISDLKVQAEHFGLFLAGSWSNSSDKEVENVAESLIKEGLVYLCVWGADCDRVEDIFDITWSRLHPNLERDGVLMTSSHSKESLKDGLFFFVRCTLPDDNFESSTPDWIAASINDDSIEAEILSYLLAGEFA